MLFTQTNARKNLSARKDVCVAFDTNIASTVLQYSRQRTSGYYLLTAPTTTTRILEY